MQTDELLKRATALGFQLQLCFKLKSLLTQLWNSEATPAWKTVARDAGGLLQRSLMKDLLLTSAQFIDETKSSSSIPNCHRDCISPHLKPGPFKKYYLPLYQEIRERQSVIKLLRDYLLAHQDRHWLEGALWRNLRNDKNEAADGKFRLGELIDLMVLFSYYVNTCNLMVGNSLHCYDDQYTHIDGAEDLRAALITAANAISGEEAT